MFYYSNESKAKVVHYEGCNHLKKSKMKTSGHLIVLRMSAKATTEYVPVVHRLQNI